MKQKSSNEAHQKLRHDLKKAGDVLKHLKKKCGDGIYDEEFGLIMEEIQISLSK